MILPNLPVFFFHRTFRLTHPRYPSGIALPAITLLFPSLIHFSSCASFFDRCPSLFSHASPFSRPHDRLQRCRLPMHPIASCFRLYVARRHCRHALHPFRRAYAIAVAAVAHIPQSSHSWWLFTKEAAGVTAAHGPGSTCRGLEAQDTVTLPSLTSAVALSLAGDHRPPPP
ncbi:hypothetical protein SETIT_9G200300v2 [Setaria italica]|uniref:Uncharacterized protein n=1 Tax=Setaria italica TaxID=4555 RepID=A0A368SII4_SETIT|nr:hypothetical protein SETIT_9G200300v2 [Setaria italica]